MKFLLNVFLDPAGRDTSTGERTLRACPPGQEASAEAFVSAVRESGELIDAQVLADPSTSASVRVRGGVPAVTDGPYLQAGAYVTGYYVLDCESRERALELAALHPGGRSDAVEVRPLMGAAGLEM